MSLVIRSKFYIVVKTEITYEVNELELQEYVTKWHISKSLTYMRRNHPTSWANLVSN